jgi:hypothetical protein
MHADKRIPVFFAAAAVTIGLMACSTPAPRADTTDAAVAEASAISQPNVLERLYQRADGNHDGRITREEARGHLPITYAEYDKIDIEKRGWISLEQYLAFHAARAKRLADGIQRVGGPN